MSIRAFAKYQMMLAAMTTKTMEAGKPAQSGPAATQIVGWRFRGLILAAKLSTALLVLIATGTGIGMVRHHQAGVAAGQALAAAENYVLTMTNLNPGDIDAVFTDLAERSTGDFRRSYAERGERLRRMLIEHQVSSRGYITDATVTKAGPDIVLAALRVAQAVTNADDTEPHLDHNRILVTMQKVSGRWLVSRMESG